MLKVTCQNTSILIKFIRLLLCHFNKQLTIYKNLQDGLLGHSIPFLIHCVHRIIVASSLHKTQCIHLVQLCHIMYINYNTTMMVANTLTIYHNLIHLAMSPLLFNLQLSKVFHDTTTSTHCVHAVSSVTQAWPRLY